MLRQIQTESGIVEGIPSGDPRITVFKGVPYAAPPVGDLRWRLPQPVKSWDGVYKADKFAPMEIQRQPGVGEPDFYTKELHPTAAATTSGVRVSTASSSSRTRRRRLSTITSMISLIFMAAPMVRAAS